MKVYYSVFLMFSCSCLFAKNNATFQKTNKRNFEVTIKTVVSLWGSGNSDVNLFMGMLTSNSYQDAGAINIDDIGEKIPFGYNGDSCIYYKIRLGRHTKNGKKIDLLNQFKISVYDLEVDFESINTIYPYDETGYTSINYTKSKKPFIDIENKQLIGISDSIWNFSDDVLDYTKNCFYYVSENFSYQNPLTGFHPLSKVIKDKGSDCGNLSSVFITLLRIKKIPARHLMGFRPDGSLHVWADFYLENYGWIPVDVKYQIEQPKEDFFGKIKFEQNGFIINRGISNIVAFDDHIRKINGLQTYSFEVNYSRVKRAKVYIDRKVFCKEITDMVSAN